MRYFNFIFACFFLFFSTNADLNAQVRKKTTTSKAAKAKEEKISFLEKFNPEIKFGNLGFFNGLSLSSKVNVGYKLHDRFTLGGGAKLFYDQFSVQGPDPSVFDLGGFVYGRGKITKEIASILNVSVNTIATHRNNIRKKLNLRKTKSNLRSYVRSIK